jgi:hypothetical protein
VGQPFIQFGSGLLFLNPNGGNLATNPTPVRPFTIQDFKLGQKAKIEALRGQSQWPDDTAAGDKDGTFEFQVGRFDFGMINQIYHADTTMSGGQSIVVAPATAIPNTPFQITPTLPGSGTLPVDLGVYNAANNAQFLKVVGTPAAGQYAVASGVYTFASADHASGISVVIASGYTTTTGATYEVNNQTQGWGPAVELWVQETYQPQSGIFSVVHVYASKIDDASFDNKRSGYGMVSVKGSFYAASTGRVVDYFSNVG